MVLPSLTVLNKQYTVQQALGDAGPFDVRYLGQNLGTKQKVVIREYLPTFLVTRTEGETSVRVPDDDQQAKHYQDGLSFFQRESEVLAGLDHAALPGGYVAFEANGTAYRARPHVAGMSLAKGLRSKGKLSEKATLNIMVPVLEALEQAHAEGLYHGGVSPYTIRLLEDGQVILTGFVGATINLARQTNNLGKLVQPGTSAVEQYTPRGKQGTWTDVYACAATICQAVTGQEVPAATKRLAATERLDDEDPVEALLQDANAFSSPAIRDTLAHALTVDPSKRLQSIEALRKALINASEKYDGTTTGYTITPSKKESTKTEEDENVVVEEFSSSGDRSARPPRPAKKVEEKETSGSKTGLLIGLPLVLVLALGGGYFVLSGSGAGGSGTGGGGTGGGDASGGGAMAATQTYQGYRTQADSLYYTANYDEARTFYSRALSERPDDAYATQRLNEITRRLNESTEARFGEFVQRGDERLARGDSLLAAGNSQDAARTLGRASAAFERAAELKPDDAMVNAKLDTVAARFSQIASAATNSGEGSGEGSGDGASTTDSESLYTLFRGQGDELIEEGSYRAAARKFEEALEFKPGDDYAEEQLRRAQKLRARQDRLRTFGRNLNQALALLDEGKPEEAQPFLDDARALYPANSRLQEAIARSEQLMAEREERQATYQQNRTAGDEAFAAERYAEAARAYRDALDARPDDDYVAERLEEARQRADEMQLATAAVERRQARRARMKEDEGTDVYTVVDEQPEVVGGLAGLHKRVRYPSRARSEGVQGRVFVEATVNADGTVRAAKVTRGIGGGCDEEALRVIRESTFEPAKVDGRPVAASKTLWIRFRIRGE